MPNLHNFAARIAAITIGALLVVAPSARAQNQQSSESNLRSAQEEDIRVAAFLYLFDVETGPDPDYSFYCLSVDSDGFKVHHDPSDSLMKRFPRMHRTLRKVSECEIVSKPKDWFTAIKDKQSGKAGWMISLSSILWINEHEVRVGGTRYCGGLCLWSSILQATLVEGKWKVALAPNGYVFVS